MAAKRERSQERAGRVVLDDEWTDRVRKIVAKLGVIKAREAFGFANCTYDNARDFGRMRPDTAERVKARVIELERQYNVREEKRAS